MKNRDGRIVFINLVLKDQKPNGYLTSNGIQVINQSLFSLPLNMRIEFCLVP